LINYGHRVEANFYQEASSEMSLNNHLRPSTGAANETGDAQTNLLRAVASAGSVTIRCRFGLDYQRE